MKPSRITRLLLLMLSFLSRAEGYAVLGLRTDAHANATAARSCWMSWAWHMRRATKALA